MHLRSKLLVGFGASATFSLIVGLIGVFALSASLTSIKDMTSNDMPSVNEIWVANEGHTAARSAARSMVIYDRTPHDISRSRKAFNDAVDRMHTALKTYEPLITPGAEQKQYQEVEESLKNWLEASEPTFRLWDVKERMIQEGIPQSNPAQYMEMNQKLTKAQTATNESFNRLEESLLKLLEINMKNTQDHAAEVTQSATNLRLLMILVVVLAFVFSMALGFRLANTTMQLLGVDPSEITEIVRKVSRGNTRSDFNPTINYGVYNDMRFMVQGLNDKARQAEAIADGDLTQDVDLLSEEDSLGRSFQKMTSVLRDVITRSNEAANQVAAGSDQVSAASQTLSQGSTEQAAAVEEISSSIQEISRKIRLNSDAATQASELARKAQAAAARGNDQIEVTLTAMEDISQSSREISKIIKAIDDIAFQTNLLALNAAVEAARAGRHGKGFAVVADEVRNLAGRSAKAARKTTELIESSSRRVEGGLTEARKTAHSFKDIVEGSLQVAETVKKIADAGGEQSAGINQIALGVEQINRVTQSTTASAEETASASEELAGQSQELKKVLSYFRVEDQRQALRIINRIAA